MIKMGLRMPETIHIGDEIYGRDCVRRYSVQEIKLINRFAGLLSNIGVELGIPDAFILNQFTKEDLDRGRIPFSFILCGECDGRRADFNNDREAEYVRRLFQEKGYAVDVDKNRGCFMFQVPLKLLLENPIAIAAQVPILSEEIILRQLALNDGFRAVLTQALSLSQRGGGIGTSTNNPLTDLGDTPGEN